VIIGDAAHRHRPPPAGSLVGCEDAVFSPSACRSAGTKAFAVYEQLRRQRSSASVAQAARVGGRKAPGVAGIIVRRRGCAVRLQVHGHGQVAGVGSTNITSTGKLRWSSRWWRCLIRRAGRALRTRSPAAISRSNTASRTLSSCVHSPRQLQHRFVRRQRIAIRMRQLLAHRHRSGWARSSALASAATSS